MMVMDKNGPAGKIATWAAGSVVVLSAVTSVALWFSHNQSETNAKLDRNLNFLLSEIKNNREKNASEHAQICLAHKQLDIDLRLHIVGERGEVEKIKIPTADC